MSLFARAAAFSAAFTFLSLSPSLAEEISQHSAVISAPAGAIRGVTENGVQAFKGIPYAAAPIGDARWKPPVAASDWEGELDASEFGDTCIQPKRRFASIYAEDPKSTSEDCLSLNIWKPKDAKNAAVFVWIHGGSLVSGSGSQTFYDGSELAKRGGVIVVSIIIALARLDILPIRN